MSKFEKALLRLRQNPKHVRYEEIEFILLHLGFEKRQVSTNHAIFRIKNQMPISIPKRKPFIKPTYVKIVLHRLEKMGFFDDE